MDPSDANGILNASGFPFQMRISHEIRNHPGKHNWQVLAEEYPWKNAETDESGFADTIAGYGAVRLIIECKRGADSTWLFLSSSIDEKQGRTVHCYCTDSEKDEPDIASWALLALSPPSPSASFCIVRGQADKEPMLERIAATQIKATESIATKEQLIRRNTRMHYYGFYLPVVVTSARLLLYRIDLNKVDISNGKINTEKMDYEEVPFVRFQKAFSAKHTSAAETIEESTKEDLRTLIVINSTKLVEFLESMDIERSSPFEPWPHQILRERLRSKV
jgi:hypothetical protein